MKGNFKKIRDLLLEPKPPERRLKENNKFREIISDCIDISCDVDDITEELNRRIRSGETVGGHIGDV